MKKSMNIRVNEKEKQIINLLAEYLGISQTDVLKKWFRDKIERTQQKKDLSYEEALNFLITDYKKKINKEA